MCIDNCIADLNAISWELDQALMRAATVWDDRVSARVDADYINNITDRTRSTISELATISAEVRLCMDRIQSLTY